VEPQQKMHSKFQVEAGCLHTNNNASPTAVMVMNTVKKTPVP
jgi:hypothetical protein